MRSKFSFARTLALALVAIGTVACVSSETFAANRTWTGNAPSPNNGKWGTAAQFASNWSGFTNPDSTDTGVFSSNSNRAITPQANMLPIGSFLFSGAGKNTFGNTAGSSIVISGTGIPSIGISSSSSADQLFQGKVVISAPTMTFETTAAGGLTFGGGGVDLAGNYLKAAASGTGIITQGSLGSSVAGGRYEVVSGTQAITFDSALGVNVSNLIVNGGLVTADGTSSTDLSVSGGTYLGGGTYKNVASAQGLVDLSNGDTLSTASFVQGSGGTLDMNVNADLTRATVNGNYELGGNMVLDGAGLGSDLFGMGTKWALFQGINYTAGSPSALNASSNFSAFAMTQSSSTSPYYGPFTRFGQEWTSPTASDGTYLVFQAQTGNLVVVPEPSTMVFAGLGVAMSGWTMWKKRRLSKLLAAKAG